MNIMEGAEPNRRSDTAALAQRLVPNIYAVFPATDSQRVSKNPPASQAWTVGVDLCHLTNRLTSFD
jgi:hypothetical protein